MVEINDFKNQLILGDCLEVMPQIPEKSIDMILCDLPYGTTACHWDVVIPFEPLWECYKRVIKPCGAIVLFGSQPFTSLLVASNLKWFKYCWVWDKGIGTNFPNANHAPLQSHEDICVFSSAGSSYGSKTMMSYHPQMEVRDSPRKSLLNAYLSNCKSPKREGFKRKEISEVVYTHRFPKSVLYFSGAENKGKIHRTQKSTSILSYLIRTYTNTGDLILDNTMGSASTIAACLETQRNYIGIEKDPEIYAKAVQRIKNLQPQLSIFDLPA